MRPFHHPLFCRLTDGGFGHPGARRSLKFALIEKSGAPLAEHRRIAAILERAAAEIRGHGAA